MQPKNKIRIGKAVSLIVASYIIFRYVSIIFRGGFHNSVVLIFPLILVFFHFSFFLGLAIKDIILAKIFYYLLFIIYFFPILFFLFPGRHVDDRLQ